MIAAVDGRFSRLAYPPRSSALASLADTAEDRDALAVLAAMSIGTLPGDNLRAYIMRPFVRPVVSRFSDGSYGVLYVANSLATAVRESAYHLSRFFSDGNAPAQDTRRAHLSLHLRATVDDIRGRTDANVPAAIHDPTDYRDAQRFGAARRTVTDGVHYDSVRNRQGGHCIAAFAPQVVTHAHLIGEISLVWDGRRFIEEHEIRPL